MLEQLINLVKEVGQDQVVNNPQVPNDINNSVMQEAASSIFSGLQNGLSNGNLTQMLDMFKSGSNSVDAIQSNPLTNSISNSFIENLMNKFGLNSGLAKTIAAAVIPMVISKLFNNASNPNDNGIQIGDIFNSLTGGQATQNSGFSNILSKLGSGVGLDKDGDGDVDLQDIIGQVSQMAGNAQNQQQQSSGGGIGDMLGGMLKGFGR